MLPQKIFKNHKIFEKKSQDLDSKSQVYKIKFLMTFYAKLKSVITSESHQLSHLNEPFALYPILRTEAQ